MTYIEVLIAKRPHDSLQPSDLKLGLVVHLSEELLTELELEFELVELLSEEIWPLLQECERTCLPH